MGFDVEQPKGRRRGALGGLVRALFRLDELGLLVNAPSRGWLQNDTSLQLNRPNRHPRPSPASHPKLEKNIYFFPPTQIQPKQSVRVRMLHMGFDMACHRRDDDGLRSTEGLVASPSRCQTLRIGHVPSRLWPNVHMQLSLLRATLNDGNCLELQKHPNDSESSMHQTLMTSTAMRLRIHRVCKSQLLSPKSARTNGVCQTAEARLLQTIRIIVNVTRSFRAMFPITDHRPNTS